MKIQPQKNCKTPKYAAALAALASAAMLTACQYDGEMAGPEGTAPAPADSVVIYEGKAVTDTLPDDMLRTEGEASVAETEPEQTDVTAIGVGMETVMNITTSASDDGEPMLDGDVICIPDTTTETTAAMPEEGAQP